MSKPTYPIIIHIKEHIVSTEDEVTGWIPEMDYLKGQHVELIKENQIRDWNGDTWFVHNSYWTPLRGDCQPNKMEIF